MTHYMFQSNASTTAVRNHEYYLMHLRIKTNIPKQSNKVHPGHYYSQSVVNQQPQHQVHRAFSAMTVPISLSLSALQYLNCQAKPNCFRLQSQGHQCKSPSSPTVPAHYRTSSVQLLTSYFQTTQISHLTHAAIQFSLMNQGH